MKEKLNLGGTEQLLAELDRMNPNRFQNPLGAVSKAQEDLTRMNTHLNPLDAFNKAQEELAHTTPQQKLPDSISHLQEELARMNKTRNPLEVVERVQQEFEAMNRIHRQSSHMDARELALEKSLHSDNRTQLQIFGEKINSLPEHVLQQFEALIPELAQSAISIARNQALKSGATLMEVINGELIETSADGSTQFIKSLPAPYIVKPGAKRIRRAN